MNSRQDPTSTAPEIHGSRVSADFRRSSPLAKREGNRALWKYIPLSLARIAIAATAIAMIFSVGMLAVGPVAAPNWMQQLTEQRLTEITGGEFVELDQMTVSFDPVRFSPLITISEAHLSDVAGLERLEFSDLQITIDPGAILRRQVQLRSIHAGATRIEAETVRLPDLGTATDDTTGPVDRSWVAEFKERSLASLEEIQLDEVEIRLWFQDVDQAVHFTDGQLQLTVEGDEIRGASRLTWQLDDSDDVAISARLTTGLSGNAFAIEFNMRGIRLHDLVEIVDIPATNVLPEGPIEVQVAMEADDEGIRDSVQWQVEIEESEDTIAAEEASFRFVSASGHGDFYPDSRRLTISHAEMLTSFGRLHAAGHWDFTSAINAEQRLAVGQLHRIEWSQTMDQKIFRDLETVSAQADFRLNLVTLELEIAQFAMHADGALITGQGSVKSTDDGWVSQLQFRFEDMNHATFAALLPARKSADWMQARVGSGRVFSGAGGFGWDQAGETELLVNLQYEDVTLEFVRDFPPVTGARGFAVVDDRSMSFMIDEGVIDGGDSRADIAGTVVRITDEADDSESVVVVEIKVRGDIQEFMQILDHSPLNLAARAGVKTDFATGDVTASAKLRLPFKDDLPLEEISFGVQANIDTVSIDDFHGVRFESGNMRVSASNEGMIISADGRFRDIPVTGTWRRSFAADVAVQPLTGTIEISADSLRKLGIRLPPGALRGEAVAEFYVAQLPGQMPEFGMTTDARSLALDIPALPLAKEFGDVAQIVVEGRLADPIQIRRFSLEGETYGLTGTVELSESGEMSTARFDSVRIGDWMDIAAELDLAGDYAVTVTGGSVDLSQAAGELSYGGSKGALNQPMRINLDDVRLTQTVVLNGLNGTIFVDEAIRGEFTGQMNAASNVRVAIKVTPANSQLQIDSSDAGELLRTAGFLSNLTGGQAIVLVTPVEGQDGVNNVRMKLTNVRARQMPALSELLNAVSIVGAIDQLNGSGILFSEIQADMLIDRDRILFRRAFATGPTIGITLSGGIDRRNGQMDVEGVITPLNVANEILRLTPLRVIGLDRGDGIGAVSYFIRGPVDRPNAGANPLSVLTPGIFRNIF